MIPLDIKERIDLTDYLIEFDNYFTESRELENELQYIPSCPQ